MSANSTAPRRDRLGAVRLYLVATFDGRRADEVLAACAAAARAGVGAVQVRAKRADTATRRALLARAREALPDGTLLLVNDDLDAVRDAHGAPLADGVHLGRQDAAARAGARAGTGPAAVAAGLAAARAALGSDLLLGASTRRLDELAAALAAGADHAGFGAIALSATKADSAPADPAELARCVRAHPDVPLFPIGGLGPATLGAVLAAGCRRAAVGAAILDAPDPADAARTLLRLLGAGAR